MTGSAPVHAGGMGMSGTVLAQIDDMLATLVSDLVLPGAVTLVARHGKIVHRSVVGLQDIATKTPLAENTIFRIFSMTKPVTAAAMMVLYDAGLWSPDDPIAKHLPAFRGVAGPDGAALDHAPTMRELLTHTAGFGYGTGMGLNDAVDRAYAEAGVWDADNLADFARRVASAPLAYQPGTSWRYSLGMDLQGAIIENLSGMTLPMFLREKIFDPLGMVDTDFYVPADKISRLATPYHKYFQPQLTILEHPWFIKPPSLIPNIASGGAGLYSTADDYWHFAQMLLNGGELDGTRIIGESSARMMMSNQLPDTLLAAGFVAGMQKIGPGRGFAFNGAVFTDPALAGSQVGKGTYQWDGAGGTWFWIDPENDIVYVGMIQRMMQDGMPALQAITQSLIAAAIADHPLAAQAAPEPGQNP